MILLPRNPSSISMAARPTAADGLNQLGTSPRTLAVALGVAQGAVVEVVDGLVALVAVVDRGVVCGGPAICPLVHPKVVGVNGEGVLLQTQRCASPRNIEHRDGTSPPTKYTFVRIRKY